MYLQKENMLFLIPILVFSGFIAGYLLKKYIPEEQKAAKPYLFWSERILLLLIIVFLLFHAQIFSPLGILTILLGMLIGFFLREVYLYLGLAFLSLDFLPAVLIFLFGLVKGNKHIIRNAFFFFFPFLLLVTKLPLEYTSFFAAGALISILLQNKY